MTDCPRCGAAVDHGQEYCVDCGLRLPSGGPAGSRALSGQAWIRRTAAALVVALAGTAAALAASDQRSDGAEIVTATGGFATLPSSTTLPSPGDASSPAVDEWPAGEDGWTIVVASIPQTEGRRTAVARARRARRAGLSPVGILDSSRYASLHPGYWIVFTGIYGSEAEATSALEPARDAVRTATVRRIVP